MFSNSSNPSPPLGKSLLGYQHGVPRISINNTGWARVFPSTPAHEMFSYWLRANLCRQLFSAINRFSRTDGIQQRYKHISRQDRRVCTQVVLCSLRLPADRAKSMESLSPLFSWQVFNFFCGWLFFFFHTVSTPVFLFNFSDKLPSLPWATHEVGHEASSPDRTSTLYLCYISECLGVCFLLTRTLGVGLCLEEKTGACAGGENHTWGFSAQRVNKNSPGHITSRI